LESVDVGEKSWATFELAIMDLIVWGFGVFFMAFLLVSADAPVRFAYNTSLAG
jgi:hypothetical protein